MVLHLVDLQMQMCGGTVFVQARSYHVNMSSLLLPTSTVLSLQLSLLPASYLSVCTQDEQGMFREVRSIETTWNFRSTAFCRAVNALNPTSSCRGVFVCYSTCSLRIPRSRVP